MVVRAGWTNTGQALLELADVGVDGEIKKSVRKAANKEIMSGSSNANRAESPVEWLGEVEVRDIQGVKAGQNYLIDIELAVPESWNLQQTRVLEDAVRSRVGSTVRGVRRVRIRIVPNESQAQEFSDEFIAAEVSPRSSPEPEDGAEHFHEVNGKGKHEHQHNGTLEDELRRRKQ